jgi:ribosomal protein S18 acetylase RimI-like enzyme
VSENRAGLQPKLKQEMELALRDVTAADVSGLLGMMRRLALQEPVIPFDERQVTAAWTQFLANAALGRAWLLIVGAEVAGYIVLTLGFSFEYRGREAFIDELYVEEKYRGWGIGRQAIKLVEVRALEMGVNVIHLEVDRGNTPALELYRRSGYVDHDRYLMTKWVRRVDS